MADFTGSPPELLTDDEVLAFVSHGYHIVDAPFPARFNESICEQIDRAGRETGNEILGEDYRMNGHRHLHENKPGSRNGS